LGNGAQLVGGKGATFQINISTGYALKGPKREKRVWLAGGGMTSSRKEPVFCKKRVWVQDISKKKPQNCGGVGQT